MLLNESSTPVFGLGRGLQKIDPSSLFFWITNEGLNAKMFATVESNLFKGV